MIEKEHILHLAEQALTGTNIYVTEVRIGSDNHINVFIDGDEGVTIKNCVDLSRAIEGRLDRNRQDFALDVGSHGATRPLLIPRQYKRHLGRDFEVKLLDGSKAEGTLVQWSEHEIKLSFSTREKKPIGKGKITVTKEQTITYEQIQESKIKLKY